MSTKIYNGYIMTDVPSLQELRKRMNKLRIVVQNALKVEHLKIVASEAVKIIDMLALGGKVYTNNKYSPSIFSKAVRKAEDNYREIEKKGLRNPEYDFFCSLSIIPIPKKVLVLVYCENPRISALIENQKYLKYYGYWNNSDPDSSCSGKEWNQREADWDKALPGAGIPSENGFEVQLNALYLSYPSIEDIIQHAPSFTERIDREARKKTIDQLRKKLWRKLKPKTSEEKIHIYNQAFWDFKDSPKSKVFFEKNRIAVAGKITETLTKELFQVELEVKSKKARVFDDDLD